jgi:hypothetical protein
MTCPVLHVGIPYGCHLFYDTFPFDGPSWTPNNAEEMQLYHSKLWEDKAKDSFYEI